MNQEEKKSKRLKLCLNVLTIMLAWSATLVCTIALVEVLRRIPCNHVGYDIRDLYLPCIMLGLWGVAGLVLLKLWKASSIAAISAACILAAQVFIFDRFNLLVEYEEWLSRGMPAIWE